MKYETNELRGKELDAAVAKILGMKAIEYFEPSRLWCCGGPIIELENISIEFGADMGIQDWTATHPGVGRGFPKIGHADTPLEAAMIAFVRAKHGDEIEL